MNKSEVELRLTRLLASHRRFVEAHVEALATMEGTPAGQRADARANAIGDAFLEEKAALVEALSHDGEDRLTQADLDRIRRWLGALLIGPGGGNKILRDMELLLHEVCRLRGEQ